MQPLDIILSDTADKSLQCFRCMKNTRHVSIIIIYTNKGDRKSVGKVQWTALWTLEGLGFFYFWSWTFCFFSTPSRRYFQDVTVLHRKCPTVYGSFPIWHTKHILCGHVKICIWSVKFMTSYIQKKERGESFCTTLIHLMAFDLLDAQIKRARRNLAEGLKSRGTEKTDTICKIQTCTYLPLSIQGFRCDGRKEGT